MKSVYSVLSEVEEVLTRAIHDLTGGEFAPKLGLAESIAILATALRDLEPYADRFFEKEKDDAS